MSSWRKPWLKRTLITLRIFAQVARANGKERSQSSISPARMLFKGALSPSRYDPLSQVATVAHFGGVRLPTIAGRKFALAIVLRQLRKGHRLCFASHVGQIDISAKCARCTKRGGLIRKPVDRSDDNPPVLAFPIGARLSPSVFPNVGATPTFAPHDAAILHGLTSEFIVDRTRGQYMRRRHNLGTNYATRNAGGR